MAQSPISTALPPAHSWRWRVMLLSCLTLGLSGAYVLLRDAHLVGRVVGKQRTSLPVGLLITVLTLGIFPGIYVVVLAFDLQRHSEAIGIAGRQRHLGPLVLLLDVLSLITAVASGGIAIALSVVLWSFGCHLLSRKLSLHVPGAA